MDEDAYEIEWEYNKQNNTTKSLLEQKTEKKLRVTHISEN